MVAWMWIRNRRIWLLRSALTLTAQRERRSDDRSAQDVGQQGGCFVSNTWMMPLPKRYPAGAPQRHSASLTCRVFCTLLNSPNLSHRVQQLPRACCSSCCFDSDAQVRSWNTFARLGSLAAADVQQFRIRSTHHRVCDWSAASYCCICTRARILLGRLLSTTTSNLRVPHLMFEDSDMNCKLKCTSHSATMIRRQHQFDAMRE